MLKDSVSLFSREGVCTVPSSSCSVPEESLLENVRAREVWLCSRLRGKAVHVRLALAACLSQSHMVLEDQPGTGKTVLARSLAQACGLRFARVQGTSDLLPTDLVGVQTWHPGRGAFEWHPGPLFAHTVLVDELNRMPPRTQSALLEAMAERQITTEGQTRRLEAPFWVVATQNPLEDHGTFPLPLAQLDRFDMCLSLGLPDAETEYALLLEEANTPLVSSPSVSSCGGEAFQPLSQNALSLAVHRVTLKPPVLAYIQAFLMKVRAEGHPLSPRAGKALVRLSRMWAWLSGKAFVCGEDVQAVAGAVVRHRLKGIPWHERDARVAQWLRDLPLDI